MTQISHVLAQHDSAEALLATARADAVEKQKTTGRRALRAEDGVDYRRRVLARLTDLDLRSAHPGSAELWKRANERLDELGL